MKFEVRVSSAIVMFAGFLSCINVRAAGHHFLMGGLGDSITAATFADGSAMRVVDEKILDTLPDFLPNVRVPFLGAKENKDTFSWVSGQEINSQSRFLAGYLQRTGDKLSVANVAVPGAIASDLNAQVDSLLKIYAKGKFDGLTYVTLLIGANDACGGTPEDEMEKNIDNALAKLAQLATNEPIHVLISSMPNIPELGREEILHMSTVAGFSCEFVRDQLIGFCPSLLRWKSQSEYNDRVAQVLAKNQTIEKVVEKAKQTYGMLNVHYSNVLYQTTIDGKMLARDCFHPNSAGQELLASTLWDEQPWFKN